MRDYPYTTETQPLADPTIRLDVPTHYERVETEYREHRVTIRVRATDHAVHNVKSILIVVSSIAGVLMILTGWQHFLTVTANAANNGQAAFAAVIVALVLAVGLAPRS